MKRGSYFGGSMIVHAAGWASLSSTYGKPKFRIGFGKAKKRAIKLAHRKKEAEPQALGIKERRKAEALASYSSFEAYSRALAKHPDLAVRQGLQSTRGRVR